VLSRRTPEQRAADNERRRIKREMNKKLYGVAEPNRLYGKKGKQIPFGAVPDPDDYAHPESDVRIGA
jgi:hypothetical protein